MGRGLKGRPFQGWPGPVGNQAQRLPFTGVSAAPAFVESRLLSLCERDREEGNRFMVGLSQHASMKERPARTLARQEPPWEKQGTEQLLDKLRLAKSGSGHSSVASRPFSKDLLSSCISQLWAKGLSGVSW